ncbi:MAG TPA: hypothetical protein DIU15_12280 [Deltaproteobacteria bacterium]|nr:hypothetical protein [Deltaproteobacteria bacterium]HCP46814.1 hypothetical protein [Deltaproteobacteria bacterium]
MLRTLVRASVRSTARPWRTLALAALVLVLALPGLTRLRVSADLSRLVPADSEASRGLGLVLEGFGGSDALYALLHTPDQEAASPERLREIGRALAEALEASDYIRSARTAPADGLQKLDPMAVFDLLDEQESGALRSKLTPEAIERRASLLRNLLSGPMSMDARDLLVRDPLGLVDLLGDHLGRSVRRMGSDSEDFLSKDGRALLMILEPAGAADGDYPARLMSELYAIRGRVLAAQGASAEVKIGFTGSYAHAFEIARATRADATVLSMASLGAILLLYLFFYRSLVSLALVVFLLPYSALLTLGFAGYLYGALNPLAVGFVAVLFGLGIDPAIHIISRYRDARLRCPPAEAAAEALEAVGPAVVVASLTTTSALLTIAVADPRGHGQIGVLAGLAVLLNAAVMLWVLPAVAVLAGRWISPDPGIGVRTAGWFAMFLYRRSRRVLVVIAAGLVALLVASQPIAYEATLAGFQPSSLEPVRVDLELKKRFGEQLGEVLVLLRGDDEQRLLEANDRWAQRLQALEAEGAIAGYESLSALRPAERTASRRRQSARASLPLAEAAQQMRVALVQQGFRVDAFEPALARLDELAASESGAMDTWALGTPQWMSWFEERHLHQVGDELRVLTRVRPVRDPVETAPTLRDLADDPGDGVGSFVTGMALVEQEAADLLKHRLPWFLAFASCVLFLVLAGYYRAPKVVAVAFVPLALSLGVYVGVHSVGQAPFTPFALAGILLLIGVGIDDQVFMLDRYLEGEGRGRLDRALAGAGRAILVTTLTSLAAFGVLSLSRFPALAEFGRSAALALTLAFLGSVVLLPTLIAWLLPGEDAP